MQIKIVSSSKEIYKNDEVAEVYAPTEEGTIGILPNHANLIANLQIGLLRIIPKENPKNEVMIVLNGGIIQVNKNVVSVLADEAHLTEELVKQEIDKAIEDAEKKIAGAVEPSELVQLERQLRYERFKIMQT